MEYTETVTGGFKSFCKDEGYQEWDSSIFVILVELLLGKAWYYLPTRIATCLMCATAPNCVCVCARMCMCTCAVFSVDYNDELDVLVSGSADFSVKVWALSAGACLNTLTGHTEWVTKVRILWFFLSEFV